MGFAAYLAALAPGTVFERAPTAAATALIWGLTAIHLLGTEQGGRFQRWITVAKIGAVAVVGAIALVWGEGHWGHLGQGVEGVAPRLGTASAPSMRRTTICTSAKAPGTRIPSRLGLRARTVSERVSRSTSGSTATIVPVWTSSDPFVRNWIVEPALRCLAYFSGTEKSTLTGSTS